MCVRHRSLVEKKLHEEGRIEMIEGGVRLKPTEARCRCHPPDEKGEGASVMLERGLVEMSKRGV